MNTININNHWTFSEYGKSDRLEAVVPGCIHTDLIRNRVIQDPFYRLNEHDVQWIDKKDWVYQTQFEVPREMRERDRVVLEFGGLDTHAVVYLNDQMILEADNMFRTWSVDVKGRVQKGSNELKIHFRSPIQTGLEKYDSYPHRILTTDNDLAGIGQVEGGKAVSPHLRKAPYHFGWDWGPRLVTSGIWKPIVLKAWDDAQIIHLHFVQNKLNDQQAKLTAQFEVGAESASGVTLGVRVGDSEITSREVALKEGIRTYGVEFEITQPKRWWTNGLGEPFLYKMTGTMETAGGVQEVTHNIGLRTLQVVMDKDEVGSSFYFKLNGHPVFMKGANYIPSDVFLNRVTPEKYAKIILTAKKSNFNMLRVWGGGIYEKDIFYDLCDEHGILVWQDFMFACSMYPGHPEFVESVAREAADHVKRLRNHPSIALWCGNNEILSEWLRGWREKAEKENRAGADAQWKAYKDLFLDVLPSTVAENDPGRFYWASSPQSGDTILEGLTGGDFHYWGVWWGKEPFERYHTCLARFMSEYGFQSFPELKTVKQYAAQSDYDIYSPVMQSHQRSAIGNVTIETYMLRDYRKPKDFESYLYMSHVLQAEGVKKAMEGHRIAMPYTMGSLYWQINDCWPVASWSSTDYYVRWKALQYFAKKAFAEVLLVLRREDTMLRVHVVSDRLSPFEAILSLRLLDFTGEVVWRSENFLDVPANGSMMHLEILLEKLLEGVKANEVILEAKLLEKGVLVSSSYFYFSAIRDIDLPDPKITLSATEASDGYTLELVSDVLAKNIYLTMEEEGFFSDNYFDLLPGETRTIQLETEASGDIPGKIRVVTIRDSY